MAGKLQERIAARIVQARKETGLSQRQLALATGNATRTVQTWEAAQRIPRADTLEQIAEVVGRPVSWFYAEDGETAAA